MKRIAFRSGQRSAFTPWFTAAPLAIALALSAAPAICGAAPTPFEGPVPRPTCAPGDRTETGLDGQLTLAERSSGASLRPYNCNLKVVGRYVGEGADHMMAWQDTCAYYTTNTAVAGANGIPEIRYPGVQVVDVSDPTNPVWTANLADPSMIQPWESLYANHTYKLLGAVQGDANAGSRPGFALYDVSNCKHPKQLAVINLPDSSIHGHAGNFAPDGNTYWGIDATNHILYAIDIKRRRNPKLIFDRMWAEDEPAHHMHRMMLNQHVANGMQPGTVAYVGVTADVASAGVFNSPNGLVILDVSDIQNRRNNADVSVISTLYWNDGAAATSPTEAVIGGKLFLIVGDEGGAASVGGEVASCNAKLPPWGYQRLVDISDLNNPVITAHLILEVQEPSNCPLTVNDVPAAEGFGYDSHDCNVDNPEDAKLLACGWQQSGVRVFDIHDPYNPREIAYYKGAARGSGPIRAGASTNTFKNPDFDLAKAYSRFVWQDGELYLWIVDGEEGLVVTKFENQAAIAALNPVPSPNNDEPNN